MTSDSTSPHFVSPRDEMHQTSPDITLHARHWEPAPDVEPVEHTWLLTHGLASNARLWDGAARELSARGHRVVTVDQRGHGRSSKPDEGYDVPTCADDLARLIDVLGLDRPSVAGQSWGGNVVLELGHRNPSVVDQIACVDGGFIDLGSSFPTWEDCAAALAPPKLAGTPLSTMEGWLNESAGDWPEEGRRGTLANFEVRADGTIAPWLTYDRHLMVLRGMWDHSPSTRYPEMEVPVLMIAADTGDEGWSARKADAVDAAIGALPTGRAVWFRPAHHDVHAQQPEAVAALLHDAATAADFYTSEGPT